MILTLSGAGIASWHGTCGPLQEWQGGKCRGHASKLEMELERWCDAWRLTKVKVETVLTQVQAYP
jgi:hypothetical protein